jgi:LemA protein
MTSLWILIVVILLILLWVAIQYNGLVAAKNRANEAYSDIDVQLKRRYDLIPNLVESVKGYAQHEDEIFTKVTAARAKALSAGNSSMADHQNAENQLSQALRSVFAVAENYPDLKASANFQQLSSELTDTENKIEAARRFYNANVRELNIKIESFPTNIFAASLGFSKMDLFETDALSREAVKVDFSTK